MEVTTPEQLWTELRRRGMSPKQFAEMTGIPLRSLYHYLRGERRMPRWMPHLIEQRLEATDTDKE